MQEKKKENETISKDVLGGLRELLVYCQFGESLNAASRERLVCGM